MRRNYCYYIAMLIILILKVSTSEQANSASSMLMPNDTITWTGAVDTNWHETGNWDPMIIPDFGIDSGHHVIIPVVTSGNYPTVSNNAGARSLVLHLGASLKVESGYNLLVEGSASEGFLNYGYLFNHGDLRIDSSFNDGLLNFPDAEIENMGSIVIIEGEGKRLQNWGSILNSGTFEVLGGLDTNMVNYPGATVENDNGSFIISGGNSTRLVNYGTILTSGSFTVGPSSAGKGLVNKPGGYIEHTSGSFAVNGGNDVRVVNYDTIKSAGSFSIDGASMGEGFINHENAYFENKGGFSTFGGSGTQFDNFGSINSSASFSLGGNPAANLFYNRAGADFFHDGPDLNFLSSGGNLLHNNGKIELMSGLSLSNASGSGLINTDSFVIHSPSGLSISSLDGYGIDNHHVLISHGPISVSNIGNTSIPVILNREGAAIHQYGSQHALNINNTTGLFALHNQGDLSVQGSLQIQGFGGINCNPFFNDSLGVVNIVGDLTVSNTSSSGTSNNGAIVNFNHFEIGDSSSIIIQNSSGVGIFNAADFITGEGCDFLIRETSNGSIFNDEGAYFLNRCDSEFRSSNGDLITNRGTHLHNEGILSLSNCFLAVNNQGYMEIDVPISQVSSLNTVFQNSDTLILGTDVVFAPFSFVDKIFENNAGGYFYSDAQLSGQFFDRLLNNSGKAVLGPSSSFTGQQLSSVISNSDTLINMGHLEARQFSGPMITTSGYFHNSGTIKSSFHSRSIESVGGYITNAGLMQFDSIGIFGMSLSGGHSFLNTEDGIIEMGYTMNSSLDNHSGLFDNRGGITIARQDTSSTGIFNNADFYNFGSIEVGENANIGIDGLTNSSSAYFLNEGTLSIGGSGVIHNHGITNEGIFVNNYCSRLDLFASLNNQDSFENRGIIEISSDSAHFNTGIFNNYGVLIFDPPGSIPNVIQSTAQEIVYVNANATGGNSGTSWENAFTDLQDALNSCTNVAQIWVAAGTYYPTTDHLDRDATFELKNGVALYGGFTGTEDSLHQRDWETNPTILSGDINGNGTLTGNSYTVVTGSGTDSTALLDGFTITMGNANGIGGAGDPSESGGGMHNNNGSPTIVNCEIIGNSAWNRGGGIYNDNSSPIMTNVTISGNTVFNGSGDLQIENKGGGGIYNNYSNPILTNVAIISNTALIGGFSIKNSGGGGIYNNISNPALTNVTISNNSVDFTGIGVTESGGVGIYNNNSSPTLIEVTINNNSIDAFITGNSNNNGGGGIHNFGSSTPFLINVSISNNSVDLSCERNQNSGGGGIYNNSSSPFLFNVAISGNSVKINDINDGIIIDFNGGGGIYNRESSPFLTNVVISGNIIHVIGSNSGGGGMYNSSSSPTVTNSIIWNNSAEGDTASTSASIFNVYNSNPEISYSLIANSRDANGVWISDIGVDSLNNIDADPLFVEDIDLTTVPATAGDLRLTICSPAINVGDNDVVPMGITTDLDGNPRFFNGGVVDMGAYEFQGTAAMPVVSCINSDAFLDENGEVTIPVSSLFEGVDSCGTLTGLIIGEDSLSFDCSQIGMDNFTVEVTDNTSLRGTSCMVTVSVIDTIPPDAVCRDITVEVDPNTAMVAITPADVDSMSWDACGIDSMAIYISVFTYADLGPNEVELTVWDASGNSSTCISTVLVEGCPPFTIECPEADSVFVGTGCQIVNAQYSLQVTTDSPCPLNFSQVPYWGQVLGVGTYTQTVNASDPAGNTATCSFSLYVLDTISPSITCPDDLTVYVDENCEAEVGDRTDEAVTSDNCGVMMTVQDIPANHVLSSGESIEVTLTVYDDSGNTATCSFEITAQDTMQPTLVCDDTDIVRDVDENCEAQVGDLTHLATATDNCITEFTVSQDIAASTILTDGENETVTLTVSDSTGWSATCQILVTAADITDPVASCDDSPVVLYVDENCATELGDYTDRLSATDNCLEESDFSVSQDPLPGEELTAGDQLTVTLIISDNNGWSANCELAVSAEDTLSPGLICLDTSIVLVVGVDCDVLLGDWTHLASAEDNCLSSGDFSTEQDIPANTVLTAGDELGVVLTVSDNNGWSADCSITVSAENQSEYEWQSTLPEDLILDCGTEVEELMLEVADFCDTQQISSVNDTLYGCMGIASITRSWTFGALSHTQTINFEDNEAPEWTSPLPGNITVECDDVPAAPTLEAIDNCSEVNVTFTETEIPGSNPGEYMLIRTWTATDECGHSISHTQYVTVVDQTPPVLNCPAEVIVDAEEQCSVPVPDLSSELEVTDNCSDSSEILLTQIPAPHLTQIVESITVYMVAEDGAGNSDFCSFTLTLINYGEENSLSCPDPVVVDAIPGECEANVSFVALSTEGCDGVEVINSHTSGGANAGGIYPLGTTAVTFELYVDGELEDECQSTVTVNDVEVPTINCPEDIVVEVDPGSCEATNPDLGAATASSSCGMVSIQINEPAEYGIGINMVTYEVTAENGLTNECTQTVTVEDNQFPMIDCPPDVTFVLSGGDCELLNPDLGVATASAICGGVSLQDDAPMAFPIGTKIVTYTATADNGQTVSCEQAVTVDGEEQVSITCPDDIEIEVSAGACEVEDLQVGEADVTGDCHGLILSNDAPSVFGIGITVVTHSVTTQGGAQLDYCEQIVEVIDNQEPTIACPDDVTVTTDPDACEATEVDLGEPDASVVCGDVTVSNNAPASFAVGATVVTYTVTADNGNTASCTQTVTVEDDQAPEISCPVDVELLIPFGETEASVTLEEATATDNCGQPDITNDYNSGGADASGTYQVGETIVTFTATDNSGNTATCVVTINIEQEDMPEPEPDTVTISGNVSSWTGLPIEEVNIIATGNHSGTYSTNEDGVYEFEVLVGSNLIVTPEKFVDWLVGVTVTDLVMIQQHILNQNLLPTPYQLIAADASNDGVISTFDIVLLQNLIVGLLDSLPSNKSKRFIDADFDFPNPSNPFSIGWPEYKAFQNVLNDKTEVDFVAVKIGDVNGDAWQSGHRYASTEYKIEAVENKSENGYQEMILRSKESMGLLGYQLEFSYDINELSFIGISTGQSVLAGINDEMFYHDEKRGVIRALWNIGVEKQIRAGEELFTIHFKGAGKETSLVGHVKLLTHGTRYRSYALNNDFPFMDVVLEWRESDHFGGFALHQNRPNPFRGTTIIPFELPRDMEVELTILDGTGRVIRTEEIEGRAGLNQHTVDLEGSPTGLLYYQINTAEWSGMKKMILVE